MHLSQTHQNAQSDLMLKTELVAPSRPAHTVLVVDDDASFRGALVELIGIDPRLRVVGSASDASEGAQMVRSLRPTICLCDVRLPGGGGE